MKKTRLGKILRYYIRRLAYNFKLLRVLKSISREKYDEKISASLVYASYLPSLWTSFSSRDVCIPVVRQDLPRLYPLLVIDF